MEEYGGFKRGDCVEVISKSIGFPIERVSLNLKNDLWVTNFTYKENRKAIVVDNSQNGWGWFFLPKDLIHINQAAKEVDYLFEDILNNV